MAKKKGRPRKDAKAETSTQTEVKLQAKGDEGSSDPQPTDLPLLPSGGGSGRQNVESRVGSLSPEAGVSNGNPKTDDG